MTKIPILGLFSLVGACAAAPWSSDRPHVRDGLLAHVPESEQAQITDARMRVLQLRDQLAAAKADEKEAEDLVEISQRNVDTLRTRASTAHEQIDHARAHRTNDDLEAARRNAEEVDSAVRFARKQTRYQENLEQLAEERIDLLQARIELAEAKVELAKAHAVSALDRPVAEEVDVDAHRRFIGDLSREVEQARIDALVARERVDLQKKYVDEGRDAVPAALLLQRVQPIDSVFEAKAFERQDGEGEAKASDAERDRARAGDDSASSRVPARPAGR